MTVSFEKQKGPPEVRASVTARTKRPHKQHTGSDPKCSCDAYLTPVSLQDRSKNGKPNPFSPDKLARLHPGQGRPLARGLERQRCIDGFQTSPEPPAVRITVSPTGPKNLRKIPTGSSSKTISNTQQWIRTPEVRELSTWLCARTSTRCCTHTSSSCSLPTGQNRQSPERAGIRR